MASPLCSTFMLVGVFVFVAAEQKNITADPGQIVTLPCRAPNGNIIVAEWSRVDLKPDFVLMYRDGHFVIVNQHPSFRNRVDLQDRQMKDGDVSMILKKVTTADSGRYECHVFLAETRSWTLSSIINLRVVPPEQKTITADPGQNVTLPCRAPNNNITITVAEWSRADLKPDFVLLYRDGHFVIVNQHPSFRNRVDLQDRQMRDGDVSMILKNVRTADSGTYECRVFMRETRTWKLNSIINLRVVPPEQKNITADSGQDVTLTCRAPNNNIIVLKWSRADLGEEHVLVYRDGHFVPGNQHPSFRNRVDLQDRQMKDGDVSVILKDVTVNNTGTYECRVAWKEPTQEIPILRLLCIITLSVAPPGPTGGGTTEDGGSVGLIIGLTVSALLIVAAGVVSLVSYRKQKQQFQVSYQRTNDVQHLVELQPL